MEEEKKANPKVIQYSLRPAKNIERKMMVEAAGRLSCISPVSKYSYIGFGSEFFNDFVLFHTKFGIKDMVSIEHEEERVKRCKFNLPFKCIKLKEGKSQDVLQALEYSKRTIIWLDYTSKLDKDVLEDVRFLISTVQSGSLLIWTVNAQPWKDEGVPTANIAQSRWSKAEQLLGKIPEEWKKEFNSLGKWDLAGLFYRRLFHEINSAIQIRNGVEKEKDHLEFQQWFHFRYADNAKMLTVGGVLVDRNDCKKLESQQFEDSFFIRTDSTAYEIKAPILTSREVRFLSKLSPFKKVPKSVNWLTHEDVDSFREIYRYYPLFSEAEL